MKIAKLEFDSPIFLAPMAGVTDVSYREICTRMGCRLTYTEMVSAKGLFYGSKNTEELMKVSPISKINAIQIFGNDPEIMATVCEKYLNNNDNFSLIDINMGCPVPKIVRNGEGSALMKNPKLAGNIVKAIKKVTNKPVTVKFRIGFDYMHINAVDFAKELEASGADAITVHGRTREQMYSGKADYNIIKNVKDSVTIPVIGNGDIFTTKDAIKIKEETNCDGIMIARGAMGNPWIFTQIQSLLDGNEVYYPTNVDRVNMCIKHYETSLKYENEYKAVREMRKHIGWYLKGLPRSTDIKNLINAESEPYKVITILKHYKQQL